MEGRRCGLSHKSTVRWPAAAHDAQWCMCFKGAAALGLEPAAHAGPTCAWRPAADMATFGENLLMPKSMILNCRGRPGAAMRRRTDVGLRMGKKAAHQAR